MKKNDGRRTRHKKQDGPRMMFKCNGCKYLHKFISHYSCKKNEKIKLTTTLNTPDECVFLKQIKRKLKIDKLNAQ